MKRATRAWPSIGRGTRAPPAGARAARRRRSGRSRGWSVGLGVAGCAAMAAGQPRQAARPPVRPARSRPGDPGRMPSPRRSARTAHAQRCRSRRAAQRPVGRCRVRREGGWHDAPRRRQPGLEPRRQRHPVHRAAGLPAGGPARGDRVTRLRADLAAAGRHRSRRVEPRPLRRRGAALGRPVDTAGDRHPARRQRHRADPRHRQRPDRRRHRLRPRGRPDAVHPVHLGAPGASTRTATGSRTRTTSSTRPPPPPTTCARPAATWRRPGARCRRS